MSSRKSRAKPYDSNNPANWTAAGHMDPLPKVSEDILYYIYVIQLSSCISVENDLLT